MAKSAEAAPRVRPASAAPNHTRCRICRKPLPAPFLDLGMMPLANAFLSAPEEGRDEPRFPLAVAGCQGCGLVQLTTVVPAEQLYRNYIYVSSTSDAVRAHAEWLAMELTRRYGWTNDSLLVEVASNDGTVLQAFQRAGLQVLGVEPARNIAALAESAGVPTVVEFFNAATARDIASRQGRAAGILGRHVFAHVDDSHDFLEGVRALLTDEGVFLVEVPYLGDLIQNLEFDTIYHEHLSYFALEPIMRLCEAHELRLVDVDRVTLHGGSVLLHMRRAEHGARPSPRLTRMLAEERAHGLGTAETLERFAASVRAWRGEFEAFVGGLRAQGARIIGYGAAAKANTLLNYCPAAAEALEAILDRSRYKHGRYTPGTHLPVRPVDTWETSGATHIVILAWNFKDEIMRQLAPFARQGGKFIVPVPHPALVEPS